VTDPTLYLFDGYNVLRAAGLDDPAELIDRLASFVAVRGARGIVVFDGAGASKTLGPLEVRFVPDADRVLERLAAENRRKERVLLVSTDVAIRETSGQEVGKQTSKAFADELRDVGHTDTVHSHLADRLDPETRDRLERLRRNRK
jgi:predicted RNA-binding protein with PIN domain